jgi:N-acetyl-anhydromuramyl-L-alanine amidase AmpD
MMRLIVHCSDSPHGRGDDASTIHSWHLQRGFDGIGYHYVITEDGTRQAGRPEYWTGSQVKNYNKGSIGICLIGRETFTPEQHSELVVLLRELRGRYPGAEILGHYQLDPGKTCPNIEMPVWLKDHGFV